MPVFYPFPLRQEVVRRLKEGVSTKILSEETGVSAPTILKWAKDWDDDPVIICGVCGVHFCHVKGYRFRITRCSQKCSALLYGENNVEKVKRIQRESKRRLRSSAEGRAREQDTYNRWYKRNSASKSRQASDRVLRLRQEDPYYKLLNRLQLRIRSALLRQGTRKNTVTEQLLGCHPREFREYIEGLFTSEMSWENFGEWHVDHFRPCSSFDLKEQAQQLACFNWRNLRPLPGIENIQKGGKWTASMEAEWVTRMAGFDGPLFLKFC